jgi:hypothetical protein
MTKLDESKRASVRPSELLAAAAAIAAGTQAYGEVVIFINPPEGEPGHFDWTLGPDDGFPGTPAQWLDITRPSTDQGGLAGPRSVAQLVFSGGSDGDSLNYTDGGASVGTDIYGGDTRPFYAGDTISGVTSDFYHVSTHAQAGHGPPSSLFPASVQAYMGVRFSDIDGYHYGWIAVMREYVWSMDFDAFAWGYETEPGVPIVAGIPAPGTLAALAFGAVVTRRKRKD